MRNVGLKLLCLLCCVTSLSACTATQPKQVVRTETVQSATPVLKALPAEMLTPVSAPPLPLVMLCRDEAGLPTWCNGQLLDWIDEWAKALRAANGRLEDIRGVQP